MHRSIRRLISSSPLLVVTGAIVTTVGACAGGAARPTPSAALTSGLPLRLGQPVTDSAGWAIANAVNGRFRLSSDRTVAHTGSASARLEPLPDHRDGSGTMLQELRADQYRGRRVRVRSWIRAQDVARGLVTASVWGEHEGSVTGLRLYTSGFDAPVEGTHGWKSVDRVIDVPENASFIRVSYTLTPSLAAVTRDPSPTVRPGNAAAGVLWVDDVTLEPVGPEVPLSVDTQGRIRAMYPDSPAELADKRARIAKLPARLVNGTFEVEVAGVTR